ncbi:unnamed protein product [Spirodela intermedia]|uniref:VOC domain-containing protein n=1 Tax=Spirodela intermedia TaxID=51605 RepID=A0A7I8IC56_SPIIN|nr:unnamed protein product [Spirodela intermedia]CAA6654944.1 unnamed protein product [Spirodela intermedia]
MAGMRPAFAYTVVYVTDVAESLEFYAKAFGYEIRRLDESHRGRRWSSVSSTPTSTPPTRSPIHLFPFSSVSDGWSFSFVLFCFLTHRCCSAAEGGGERAVPVSAPEEKEWGQKVGYVRDLDGIVVRLGSHVSPPHQRCA